MKISVARSAQVYCAGLALYLFDIARHCSGGAPRATRADETIPVTEPCPARTR